MTKCPSAYTALRCGPHTESLWWNWAPGTFRANLLVNTSFIEFSPFPVSLFSFHHLCILGLLQKTKLYPDTCFKLRHNKKVWSWSSRLQGANYEFWIKIIICSGFVTRLSSLLNGMTDASSESKHAWNPASEQKGGFGTPPQEVAAWPLEDQGSPFLGFTPMRHSVSLQIM